MANKQEGWISIHRKIENCAIWDDKPFARGQAWIDLLLIANHDDVETFHDGKPVVVSRGQKITSIKFLAERWGWSRHKVSDYLNYLEKNNMIIQKRDTKKTLITIVNYNTYQNPKNKTGHHRDITGTSEGHHRDTNNNVNNKNNENNIPPLSPQGEGWEKKSNKDNLIWLLNNGYAEASVFKNHPKLYEAVKSWMEYKDARKPKSTHHYASAKSMTTLLNKIVNSSKSCGADAVVNAIEDSIGNNYSGIVWDKIPKKKNDDLEGWLND
jgi:hypothetical protein